MRNPELSGVIGETSDISEIERKIGKGAFQALSLEQAKMLRREEEKQKMKLEELLKEQYELEEKLAVLSKSCTVSAPMKVLALD